jgi:hypothetical protein
VDEFSSPAQTRPESNNASAPNVPRKMYPFKLLRGSLESNHFGSPDEKIEYYESRDIQGLVNSY